MSVTDFADAMRGAGRLAQAMRGAQTLARIAQQIKAGQTEQYQPSGGNTGGGGGGGVAAPVVSTLASLPQSPLLDELVKKGLIKEGMPVEQALAILQLGQMRGGVAIDVEALMKEIQADYENYSGDIFGDAETWMKDLYGTAMPNPNDPNSAMYKSDPIWADTAGGLSQIQETGEQNLQTDLNWFRKQQEADQQYYDQMMTGISTGTIPMPTAEAAGGGGGGGGGRRGGGGYGGGGSGGGNDLGFGDIQTTLKTTDTETEEAQQRYYENWPGFRQAILDQVINNPILQNNPDRQAELFSEVEYILDTNQDPMAAQAAVAERIRELDTDVQGYLDVEQSNLDWEAQAPGEWQGLLNQLQEAGYTQGDNPYTTEGDNPIEDTGTQFTLPVEALAEGPISTYSPERQAELDQLSSFVNETIAGASGGQHYNMNQVAGLVNMMPKLQELARGYLGRPSPMPTGDTGELGEVTDTAGALGGAQSIVDQIRASGGVPTYEQNQAAAQAAAQYPEPRMEFLAQNRDDNPNTYTAEEIQGGIPAASQGGDFNQQLREVMRGLPGEQGAGLRRDPVDIVNTLENMYNWSPEQAQLAEAAIGAEQQRRLNDISKIEERGGASDAIQEAIRNTRNSLNIPSIVEKIRAIAGPQNLAPGTNLGTASGSPFSVPTPSPTGPWHPGDPIMANGNTPVAPTAPGPPPITINGQPNPAYQEYLQQQMTGNTGPNTEYTGNTGGGYQPDVSQMGDVLAQASGSSTTPPTGVNEYGQPTFPLGFQGISPIMQALQKIQGVDTPGPIPEPPTRNPYDIVQAARAAQNAIGTVQGVAGSALSGVAGGAGPTSNALSAAYNAGSAPADMRMSSGDAENPSGFEQYVSEHQGDENISGIQPTTDQNALLEALMGKLLGEGGPLPTAVRDPLALRSSQQYEEWSKGWPSLEQAEQANYGRPHYQQQVDSPEVQQSNMDLANLLYNVKGAIGTYNPNVGAAQSYNKWTETQKGIDSIARQVRSYETPAAQAFSEPAIPDVESDLMHNLLAGLPVETELDDSDYDTDYGMELGKIPSTGLAGRIRQGTDDSVFKIVNAASELRNREIAQRQAAATAAAAANRISSGGPKVYAGGGGGDKGKSAATSVRNMGQAMQGVQRIVEALRRLKGM